MRGLTVRLSALDVLIHRNIQFIRRVANVYVVAIGFWFSALLWSWLLEYTSPWTVFFVTAAISILIGILFAIKHPKIGVAVGGVGTLIGAVLAIFIETAKAICQWILTEGVAFGHSQWGLITLLGLGFLFGFLICGAPVWAVFMKSGEYLGRVIFGTIWGFCKTVIGLCIIWGLSYVFNYITSSYSGWSLFFGTAGIFTGVGLILLLALRNKGGIQAAAISTVVGCILGALCGVLSAPVHSLTTWILNEGVSFLFNWEGMCWVAALSLRTAFGDDQEKSD